MNLTLDITTIQPYLSKSSGNISLAVTARQNKDTTVTDGFLSTFTTVVDMWLSLVLSTFGVISNIITLVVFTKLGFKDTVNITMTSITLWDLVRVLCGSLHRLYGPMSLVSEALGTSWQNITLTNIVYLHIVAGNVSYVIGGYVALERCLCVIAPFKVRTIITPKLTTIVCWTISICVFVSQFPIFLIFEYTWMYNVQYIQDIAIYRYTQFYSVHGQKVLEVFRSFSFVYPTVSLTSMIVSTVVISYQLGNSSNFRQKISSVSLGKRTDSTKPELSARERQVIKMLLVVIAVYMVNLVPRVVHYMALLSEAEYFTMRYYNNVFWIVLYVIFFLDFVNSSANVFVFYHMSSKFRQCFQSLCLGCVP